MKIFASRSAKSILPATYVLALLLIVAGAVQAAQPTASSTPAEGSAPPVAAAPGEAVTPELTPSLPTVPAAGPPAPGAQQRQRAKEALLSKEFDYVPTNLADPFLPFIKAEETGPVELESTDEESVSRPAQQRPMTPLQKMSLSEIEKGLKAIMWGEMGRKAVIEDAAGKGYIVGVGTPAGANNGVITEVFSDRLVIQQEVWDQQIKQMVPQIAVVKLSKEETEQKKR